MKKINLKSLSIILAFLLVIPLINSCEDNDEDEFTFYDTYIEGYIKDYHTGKPVEGVIFDAAYIDPSNTGTFTSDPYYVRNVAISNSEGYYKIKVPKHGEFGSPKVSVDFTAIKITPRETENYSFEFKTFNIKNQKLDVENKRVDITPVTYGYLKVIMPKDYTEMWAINPWEASTYERPFYKGKFIEKQSFNTEYKLLLFKVPLEKTRFSYGNNYVNDYDFTIINPKDTITLNVEK